ncbi:MAG: MarR family transcriptional regulator [Deltaproteobacteria bacterium]|nr:MarR family transcriptional regulator [Deltaproteobacteria bacterium]
MAQPTRTAPASPERLPLNPRLEFMRLLWAVDHALQSASKRLESRAGVTGPQRLVLRIVGCFPQISAGELAEVLVTHPSTLSGVLKRLEARGYLERKADPSDARRAQLRLTRKGRSIDALRAGTVESSIQRLLSRTTEADLAAAGRVLQALAAELGPRR